MSSFYFLEDGDFNLFPDISIAGVGKVGSVLLFSRSELKDLDGEIIDVPDSSATSIKLLQLLLKEEFGVEPVLRKQLDSIDFRADAKAVLFIGDKALKFDECSDGSMRVDLASWWKKQYELPFVFGVWGARKNWAQSNQKHFEEIGASLVQACKLGLSTQLGAVIKEAAGRTGMTHERLSDYYLNELDYRLTDQHIEALRLFETLCRKHGFLPPATSALS
jgi:chorismate dehydratase